MQFSPQVQSGTERPQVLLVHNDDGVRRSLQLLLNGWGFEVRAFAATTPVLSGGSNDADILLVDDQLGSRDNAAMVDALRRKGWRGRAILMSQSSGDDLTSMATVPGFAAIVRNPPREIELLGAMGR